MCAVAVAQGPAGVVSLVVGDLTETWMDESYLMHTFSQMGHVPIACRLARTDGTEGAIGFAVVQMTDRRAARRIIREHGAAGIPALHPYKMDVRIRTSPRAVSL